MDEPSKRPAARVPHSYSSSVRKVAILGFGTVGRSVAEILCRRPQAGLRLTHVFNRRVERKRLAWVPDDVQWTDDFRDVLAGNADLVVELIGGVEPALEFIRQALLSGKSVVTANKTVVARHGVELMQLARQTGQRLEYGASVGGGVPILAALQHGLGGDRLLRVCGILNGTCNYILSSMENSGAMLPAALAEAQKLGYAESDPSDDVHGLDAACKLAIVIRSAFRADVRAWDIRRQSINDIQPLDFHFARDLGCTIRQISFAELIGNCIHAAVGPALVPLNSPFGRTQSNQNAIIFSGENTGDTLLAGQGAGGHPTAVAVVSDLLASIHPANYTEAASVALENRAVEEPERAHYVRFSTRKKKASLELLTGILSEQGIAIDSGVAPVLKSTHLAVVIRRCSGSALQKAIASFAELESLSQQTPLTLPILS